MKTILSDIVIDAYRKQHGVRLQESDLGFLVTNSRDLEIIQTFIKDDTAPAYIFRVASTGKAKRKLSCHRRILEMLSKATVEAIRSSVPQVYSFTESGEDSILLEQAMPGISLNSIIAPSGTDISVISSFAKLATDWLISFQQATAVQRQPLCDFLKSAYVRATLEENERQHQPFRAAEKEQIDLFLEELCRLPEIAVSLSLQHNDFSSYNILYDQRTQRLSVLDWEHGEQEGLALMDLFYFLVVLASVLRGIREGSSQPLKLRSFSGNIHTIFPDQRDFSAVFLDNSWLQGLSKTCIDFFIKATGFDRRLLPLCVFLFVLRNLKYCPECLTVFLKRKKEIRVFEPE